jgi:hypothetical protein
MHKIKPFFTKLKYRERVLCFLVLSVTALMLSKILVLDQVRGILELKGRANQIHSEMHRIEGSLAQIANTQLPDSKRDPLWTYRNQNLGLASFMKVIGEVDAQREDLVVRKVASEKQELIQDYEKTTLQLEIDTPFNSLGRLLEEIERSKLLTRVEKIQIMRIENELRLCRARVFLNAYSWRNP